MKRSMRGLGGALLLGMLLSLSGSSPVTVRARTPEAVVSGLAAGRLGAQVFAGWTLAIADAKGSTTNKSAPAAAALASPISVMRLGSATGCILMVQYDASSSLTNGPVVRVYSLKGSKWFPVKDADGSRAITISGDAADPVSTDTLSKYTATTEFIDAKGGEAMIAVLDTDAVSTGAVLVWMTPY